MSQRELVELEAQLDQWEVEQGFPEDDERIDEVGSLHHSESGSASCHDGASGGLGMFGGD